MFCAASDQSGNGNGMFTDRPPPLPQTSGRAGASGRPARARAARPGRGPARAPACRRAAVRTHNLLRSAGSVLIRVMVRDALDLSYTYARPKAETCAAISFNNRVLTMTIMD